MSAGRVRGNKPTRNLDRASDTYMKGDKAKDYKEMTKVVDMGYGPKSVKGSNKTKSSMRVYPSGGNY